MFSSRNCNNLIFLTEMAESRSRNNSPRCHHEVAVADNTQPAAALNASSDCPRRHEPDPTVVVVCPKSHRLWPAHLSALPPPLGRNSWALYLEFAERKHPQNLEGYRIEGDLGIGFYNVPPESNLRLTISCRPPVMHTVDQNVPVSEQGVIEPAPLMF